MINMVNQSEDRILLTMNVNDNHSKMLWNINGELVGIVVINNTTDIKVT